MALEARDHRREPSVTATMETASVLLTLGSFKLSRTVTPMDTVKDINRLLVSICVHFQKIHIITED